MLENKTLIFVPTSLPLSLTRRGDMGGKKKRILQTSKTVQSNRLDSLFLVTEKSFARGLRKLGGSRQCFNRFCTVTRISTSVSLERNIKRNHSSINL